MLLIRSACTDPAWNLAAEEYLLNTAADPLCMLWRNEKAVVVGRNQNTLAEVNMEYAREHGIPVIRRLTGGGAVFHDLGNINFTMIEPQSDGHFSDYAWFTGDLIEFLASLGVRAELNGRNDVLVGGKKCCGNAQCVKDGRVLHHGCVLYDTDLGKLVAALKANPEKLAGKGISSIFSRVTNVREHMANDMEPAEFMRAFGDFLLARHGCEECFFSKSDFEKICGIAAGKYELGSWNFGASPEWEGGISP